MSLHTDNPGAEAGVAGSLVKALAGAIDCQQHNLKAHENLAVRHIARRLRLTVSTARVVAELSGLGSFGRIG